MYSLCQGCSLSKRAGYTQNPNSRPVPLPSPSPSIFPLPSVLHTSIRTLSYPTPCPLPLVSLTHLLDTLPPFVTPPCTTNLYLSLHPPLSPTVPLSRWLSRGTNLRQSSSDADPTQPVDGMHVCKLLLRTDPLWMLLCLPSWMVPWGCSSRVPLFFSGFSQCCMCSSMRVPNLIPDLSVWWFTCQDPL